MKHWLSLELSSITLAYLPRLAIAILIGLLFWGIAATARALLLKYTCHHPSRRYLLKLIAKSVYVVLLIMGFITALGSLGINIAAMVTSLGLAGFALSFALKDALSNAIAGFMLLFYQPFKIGETISIHGVKKGEVMAINLRYTQLTAGEQTYLVPNVTLMNSTIEILTPPLLSTKDILAESSSYPNTD